MRNEKILKVLQKVHLSEKTSNQQGDCSVVSFKVLKGASKSEIRTAVEELLSVKVQSVRTSIVKPRTVRFGNSTGQQKAWKKAYVTLQPGQSLEDLGES